MDNKARAIRVMLAKMAPCRSIPYIKAFELPPEEEVCIIDREYRGKSVLQIANEHSMSVETVKRRRKSGFEKISNSI